VGEVKGWAGLVVNQNKKDFEELRARTRQTNQKSWHALHAPRTFSLPARATPNKYRLVFA